LFFFCFVEYKKKEEENKRKKERRKKKEKRERRKKGRREKEDVEMKEWGRWGYLHNLMIVRVWVNGSSMHPHILNPFDLSFTACGDATLDQIKAIDQINGPNSIC